VARNTSTAVAEKVTRPRKSAAEKAQATLDQAQKRHDKALAKREKITAELAANDIEVLQAERFLTFAEGDPNLPQEPQAAELDFSAPDIQETSAA
jgi:hypothetical protein